MQKVLAIAAVVAFGSSSVFAANPFGIEMSMSVSQLDVKDSGNRPFLNSVPNPHPLFEVYGVWASDVTGVCAVIAMSDIFENDSFGLNVRSKFEDISAALSAVYGEATRIDYLFPNALWNEPDEWVMAIRQNERFFADNFENVAETEQGSNLSSLEINVAAFSQNSTIIRIVYKFENFEECEAAIAAEENSSL